MFFNNIHDNKNYSLLSYTSYKLLIDSFITFYITFNFINPYFLDQI